MFFFWFWFFLWGMVNYIREESFLLPIMYRPDCQPFKTQVEKPPRILPFNSEIFPVLSLFSPHSALLGSTTVESKPHPLLAWCGLVTDQHRARF